MDRLVWDIETLQRMTALLREASERMEESHGELRQLCARGEELLISEDGTTGQIMEQAERCVREAGQAAERCAALAGGLEQVMDSLIAAEGSLRKLSEELPTGPDTESGASCPGSGAGENGLPEEWHVIFAEGITLMLRQSRYSVVPDWLSRLADRVFGL